MKRLLNTLYVTTQGAYLSRESQTIHVQVEQETAMRVPVQQLVSVVCLGNVAFSSGFLALCSEFGVSVSCLSESGRFQDTGRGERHNNTQACQKEGSTHQSSNQGQTGSGGQG